MEETLAKLEANIDKLMYFKNDFYNAADVVCDECSRIFITTEDNCSVCRVRMVAIDKAHNLGRKS